MRAIPLLLVSLLLALASTAAGRDIFVDNNVGDDQFTGEQPRRTPDMTGPVYSLGQALRLAQPGDAIIVAKTDVPFFESLSLVGNRHSGSRQQPFTIIGNGAILDGSAPIRSHAWKPYKDSIFRFRPQAMSHQQLFLDGLPALQVAVAPSQHEPPPLKPRQWCSVDGYIYFCVDHDKQPSDYRLSCASRKTGITLFQVENVRLSNLIVQGYQIDGIQLANSARQVSLVGVVCRGNGRAGVVVGGASSVDLDPSTGLGDNGRAQLLTLPYSEAHVRGTLLSNTAPAWVDQGGTV